MSTSYILVTTNRGRQINVVEHTAMIDTGSKTGGGLVAGRKTIRLQDGSAVATDDGKLFTMQSGETFTLP